jgi:hypothetical protein
MLTADGVCWLGDAGRQHGGTFWKRARDAGWNVELSNVRGERLDAPIVGEFQLMVLMRRESGDAG